ncbi:hypothetical protein PspLS_04003 [Pyricularia sp. CBS 133598]|nr:hypothetical protein PspLS_04003 [Pyricularia sp. CBS 133598]
MRLQNASLWVLISNCWLHTPAIASSHDGVDNENLASIPSGDLLSETSEWLQRDTHLTSLRHQAEKEQLLLRMDKSHGSWDTNHPRARLLDALAAYSQFGELTRAELKRWRDLYRNVPQKQKNILESAAGYSAKLDTAEELADANGQLCKRIVETALEFYQLKPRELRDHIAALKHAGRTPDRISVSQALKHYVRDWSSEGQSERDDAFPCIKSTLQSFFPDRETAPVKLLLPGAGLGRLGHDVAALGNFEVTGNEWSMYMNVAYRFLEAHANPNSFVTHPFIDNWSHHATTANQFRAVSSPDVRVNTSAALLVEGDFTTVFSKPDKKDMAAYDAVVTHFFIDTARNLMSYIDTIYAVLKPGGYWINFGPLLYGTGPWVQLSLDEVVRVVKAMGFEFVPLGAPDACGPVTLDGELVRGTRAVYGFDERALTRNAYAAQAWAVRKIAH